MKFRDFKPEYDRILLYATTYERKYLKGLGMGEKSVFVKYFDAEVINTITDNKLRTVKVLIFVVFILISPFIIKSYFCCIINIINTSVF